VQVNQYPPLRIDRTDDWGWRMRNNYVVFHTFDNGGDPSKEPPPRRPRLPPGARPVLVRVGRINYIVMGVVNDAGEIEIDDDILNAFDMNAEDRDLVDADPADDEGDLDVRELDDDDGPFETFHDVDEDDDDMDFEPTTDAASSDG